MPERGLVCTNASGVNQLYAWSVDTQALRQLTTHPEGKSRGHLAARGYYVYYLEDQQGNELGHYVRVPFEGGEPQDLTPTLPPYASNSWSENRAGTQLGFIAADAAGFQLYLLDQPDNVVLAPPRLLWRSPALCRGLTFSADGTVVVVASTARTGTRAFSLMAWETASGKLIHELYEDDTSFSPIGFSPLAGDQRLLATSDRSGFNRPFFWEPTSGAVVELPLAAVQGELEVWDWSADGSSATRTNRSTCWHSTQRQRQPGLSWRQGQHHPVARGDQ